ncbi:MAG: UDP-N-acetylglucosamine--N-acetylmuramyl-(pentapeptide) pyrophosphoryl-undecaprenol N-acetylglucosamine transferase [Opitutales bacterium]|nr:UDP-N-acetylglucosamine--N-acetylmuramyl-(pentapeptide) pyrophosphoryl-undecaprenol N-acetylglucosamine transferase [Opitutales bacterium]
MSRFVIACGGTGGHLAPGIAVAEELSLRGHECIMLVSRKGVDKRLSSKYEKLRFVPGPGIGMSMHPVRFVKFVASQIHALVFAFGLLREKPDAVMAFGGFTSMGLVIAAWMKRVPVALHEANRQPGRAIRFLRHFAKHVYLPDGVRLSGLPLTRTRYFGYPVRREIHRGDRCQARTDMGFDPNGKLLIVLGGSQGASTLNNWAVNNAKALCSNGISVCCVSGPSKEVPADFEMPDNMGGVARVRFLPFCDDMGSLLNAADLAVSRAGAGSIAELTECVLPSILVPYPFAADNHQLANAQYHEKQGCCVLVEQTRIESLLAEVLDLLFSDWLLGRMCFNLEQARRPECSAQIAEDLLNLGSYAAEITETKHGRERH